MRSTFRTGGLLLIFGLLISVSPSLSDTKPAQKVAPSRIGLVNLKEVFKGYKKAVAAGVPKNEEQTAAIYKDIVAAAERYARAHDLDLVMHYKDEPANSPDFFRGANISRRIQIGAALPMFIGPRLEITKDIVAELNKAKDDDKETPVPEAVKLRPGPRSHIALVNLAEVLKGYQRVTAFSAASKKMMEPYQEKAKALRLQIEAYVKALKNEDLSPDQRIQIERNRALGQLGLEKISNQAKAEYAKKNEEQMLIVYKEVMASAERCIRGHEIDLLMHYNDFPPDQPELFFDPINVKRKVSAGACIPLYIAPGLEITKQVVTDLNERYQREKESP